MTDDQISEQQVEQVSATSREDVSNDFSRASGHTWSGRQIKEEYRPEDLADIDYESDIGDAGEEPYTRGTYPGMYRDQLWMNRQLCGLQSPEATNDRLKYLIDEGQEGLAIVPDNPTQHGLDSDHPTAKASVGAQGVPLSTMDDMLAMYDGIDMEKYTSSFSNTWVGVFALYLAAAERKGADVSKVRGSFQTDPLSSYPTGYDIDFHADYSLRLPMDAMEFCIEHDMNWTPIVTNTYDIREMGVTAAEEAGYGIACALGYLEKAVDRGMDPAEVAPRIAAISSAHIDVFEEAAKFRAMRRAWSHLLTERLGVEDESAKRLTIPVHTAGSWCFREQPINNVIRASFQALGATLGGVRAMDIASYDEPTRLPSEEASRVALRTQQILAHEVNVGGTADPLGGSYYIESMTDDIFEEILDIVERIDDRGGMIEAVDSGWFKRTLEESSSELQRDIDRGERVVVGKNCYRIKEEDEILDIEQRGESEPNPARIETLERHREQRDDGPLHDRLTELYDETADGNNVVRPMMEAAKADATLGELLGTVRAAHGHSFDPLEMVDSPFEF